MRQRVQTAVVGIPLGLVLIYLGGWYLMAAVAVLAVLGMLEFCRLTRVEDRRVAWLAYLPSVALIAVAQLLHGKAYGQVGVGLVCLVAIDRLGFAWAWGRREAVPVLHQQVAAVTLGWLYVAYLFGFLLQLRSLEALRPLPHWLPSGAAWLALVITACWAVDTAAYLVGRAIGRHRLAPKISPGKTVEGGLAGLAAAIVWVGGLGLLLGLTVPRSALLGAFLGVGGQVGDLFESLLKRRAGVKDSGALLPGHGGVLDRFDSLLFCAPLAFAFLYATMR